MARICVSTSEARAYYTIVSKLREAGLPFSSLVLGRANAQCDLVLTTRAEVSSFMGQALALEDLDEDPFVFKGQLLSRLDRGEESLLVGVDPGTRIGMAAYYGDAKLEFETFGSAGDLCEKVTAFMTKVPARKFIVRIGNGNPAMAIALASSLVDRAPNASIEIVDESGTSARGAKMKGVQGDQRAAARIAFRKGALFMQNSRNLR